MQPPSMSKGPAATKPPLTKSAQIKTGAMKRVAPPAGTKAPQLVPTATSNEALIEALRQRVNDLETRLAALESVISVQNQDVVINSQKSVLIQAMTTVELTGATIQASAAMTEVNSALTKATGVIQCDTIIATNVVGASYTPGAGNIW